MNLLNEHRDILEKLEILQQKLNHIAGEADSSLTSDPSLKIQRVNYVLEKLGHPERSFSIIHVTGTSGKGSTSTYIASILRSNGYRAGLFLSPYAQLLNEMFLVNGCMARTSDLMNILHEVEPVFLELAAQKNFGEPIHFEIKFAIALMLFKYAKVDVAVLEAGIGGTYATTNAVPSDISVLVSAGLDHTDVLGYTLEEIASHKAGVINKNSIAICGFTQESTRRIALNRAKEQQAKIFLINEDFEYKYNEEYSSIKTGKFDKENIALPILGEHQAHNAACAVMTCEQFAQLKGSSLPEALVLKGLGAAKISCRSEIVQTRPTVILDGAHNPDKLLAFFKKVESLHARPIVILAVKKGKSINEQIFDTLRTIKAKAIIATSYQKNVVSSPLNPEELLKELKLHADKSIEMLAIPDPLEAIKHALEMANEDDLIAAAGTLPLAGDVREYWHPKEAILTAIETDWVENVG